MIIKGKEYAAEGTDAKGRNILKRRAVYIVDNNPTPEQKEIIKELESGFHGDWGNNKDPYWFMRKAEIKGIELAEEELLPNGKWARTANPDVGITNMMEGSL